MPGTISSAAFSKLGARAPQGVKARLSQKTTREAKIVYEFNWLQLNIHSNTITCQEGILLMNRDVWAWSYMNWQVTTSLDSFGDCHPASSVLHELSRENLVLVTDVSRSCGTLRPLIYLCYLVSQEKTKQKKKEALIMSIISQDCNWTSYLMTKI